MNCIYCNGKTIVMDTASSKIANHRRRKCVSCGKCFFTIEVVDENGIAKSELNIKSEKSKMKNEMRKKK